MPYPAKKTPKLIKEVLEGIAKGETLTSLSRRLDFHAVSWCSWVREDEELKLAYQRARDIGHDALADQTLEIADGTKAINEHIQLSRLRIDTRLKLLASWSPNKYGPKSTVDLGNKEGETFKSEGDAAAVAAAAVAVVTTLRDAKRNA